MERYNQDLTQEATEMWGFATGRVVSATTRKEKKNYWRKLD